MKSIQSKFYSITLLVMAFCFLPSKIMGQEDQALVELIWQKTNMGNVKDSTKLELLTFDHPNRSFEYFPIAYFSKNFSCAENSYLKFELQKTTFINSPFGELIHEGQAVVNFIDNELELEVDSSIKSGVKHYRINLLPAVAKDGQLHLLKSFKLNTTQHLISDFNFSKLSSSQKRSKKDLFAEKSMLAEGQWFKVAVLETGVYRLSRNALQELGIPVEEIDPRKIRVFGSGGMQPEEVNDDFIDDLKELPILVSGEENGRFNSGDQVVFYAQGPHTWTFNSSGERYVHQLNHYCDTAFYFINIEQENGKRLTSAEEIQDHEVEITTFPDYAFHEKEFFNEDVHRYVKTGRNWLGEAFDQRNRQRNFSFSFEDLVLPQEGTIDFVMHARSRQQTSYRLTVNGTEVSSGNFSAVGSYYLNDRTNRLNIQRFFNANSNNINVGVQYQAPNNADNAWLKFIRLNVTRMLRFRSNSPLYFRHHPELDSHNAQTGLFKLQTSGRKPMVWKVSDIHDAQVVQTRLNGNELQFSARIDQAEDYVAFEIEQTSRPILMGRQKNQNLHGLSTPDYLIVTTPKLKAVAEAFKSFHVQHNGFDVEIVEIRDIYNEFSSGRQDLAAIRNFHRMFYERNPDKFKYVFFIGNASYDFKDRVSQRFTNSNFVPTYQSDNSTHPIESYSTDDYFGFLEDGADLRRSASTLKVRIGRLPIYEEAEGFAYLDKVERYTSPESVGNWKNRIMMVADDGDNHLHLRDSDIMSRFIEKDHQAYIIDKLYSATFPRVSSPAGARYPEVNRRINEGINEGALLVNFIGHGGETGWTEERILEMADINGWRNEHYPLFITATCDFGRFDDPERVSGGEKTVIMPNAGAIASMTTGRVVYASSNRALLLEIFNQNLLDESRGRTFGGIFNLAKNRLYSNAGGITMRNTYKFILLGDPALELNTPKHDLTTLRINESNLQDTFGLDTLKAMQLATIEGEVIHRNGTPMNDFNGTLFPTVYDKPSTKRTNGIADEEIRNVSVFQNTLFRGRVPVENGRFTFSFVVPKDISYQIDTGKISYYYHNEYTDGNGHSEEFYVGGTADNPVDATARPEVELFLNDYFFKDGDVTNESPLLIARLTSETGINITGNSIGHDITMRLNDETPRIMNAYYEADLNSFQNGEVRFRLENLAEGRYEVWMRAWDVLNNSGEGSTTFRVMPAEAFEIEQLFNFPNPVNASAGASTTFEFLHNRNNEQFRATLRIFNANGKMVKTMKKTVFAEGNRIRLLEWDGRSQNGHPLSPGLYIYHLTLEAEDGKTVSKGERLIIY